MSNDVITRSGTTQAMTNLLGGKSHGLVADDLTAGRFIKDAARSAGLWVTYKPTSKTTGEWFVWNGIIHEQIEYELDDLLVTSFLDAASDAWARFNAAAARARSIYEGSALYRALASQAKDEDTKPPTVSELDEDQLDLVPGLADARRVAEIVWLSVKVSRSDLAYWHSAPGINRLKERVRQELRVPPGYFKANRDYIVMSNGFCYDVNDLSKALAPSHERPVIRHLSVGMEVHGEAKSWEDLSRIADSMGYPRWQAWLDEFVPNKDDQRYLQEACGAALLGRGKARNIVHLVGPPATGKTTFLNIMEMIFGRRSQFGYAGTLSKEAIVKRQGSNFMQAEARDVRFLKLSEPSTDRTDDSFLKNLSGGGEAIVTEKKNQNPEEWYAECVLFVAANSVLRFATWDTALVNRLNIVHFNTRVKHIDPDFDEALVAAEGPAILAWVLEGAERYQHRGSIHVPQCITDRAESNVIDSSNVLRWLQDQETYSVVRSEDVKVNRCVLQSDAFKSYQEWCFDSGEKARTKRSFVDDIHRFTGLPEGKSVRSDGTRLYGVTLRSADERAEYEKFKGIINQEFDGQ